jgi:hypothetical protein
MIEQIFWLVQGDYHPIVQVIYKNSTMVTQTYLDYKVSVISYFVVEQEKYNKLTLGLIITFFVFAFIESIFFIERLIRRFSKKIRLSD